MTIGARYFVADLDDEQINQQSIYPDYFAGVVDTPSVTQPEPLARDQATFNFALLWAATPDISFYARAASGFPHRRHQPGRHHRLSGGGSPSPPPMAPTACGTTKRGAKIYLLDRRLHLDMAVYHIDWDGEQESALADGVYSYTLNVGKTSVNGGELRRPTSRSRT